MIKKTIKNLKISSTLKINEVSKELEKKGEKVFKFGFGQSPFEIPENIVFRYFHFLFFIFHLLFIKGSDSKQLKINEIFIVGPRHRTK